ncbi:MAG TPA: hypothetical protein H9987_07845 [Candidatus Luteococcus avicola]|nr:hypothetical protein [Candidatus Luteococcus avicola]
MSEGLGSNQLGEAVGEDLRQAGWGPWAVALLFVGGLVALGGHHVGAGVVLMSTLMPWLLVGGFLKMDAPPSRTRTTAHYLCLAGFGVLLSMACIIGSWIGDFWLVDAARPSELSLAVLPGLVAAAAALAIGLRRGFAPMRPVGVLLLVLAAMVGTGLFETIVDGHGLAGMGTMAWSGLANLTAVSALLVSWRVSQSRV